MSPPKTVSFKPEYAFDLIEIAKGDLQTAKALIASANPGRLENILYMIQQCVEKSIKSVLIFKQTSLPMVHDLGILVALLPVNDYPPGGFDWTSLNPYASIRRYEAGPIALEKTEVQGAYDAALLVIDWANAQLKKV